MRSSTKLLGFLLLSIGAVSISACNFQLDDANRGPIILGDSSTIVTETDPKFLEDAIIDIKDSLEDELETPNTEDSFNNVAMAALLAKQQDSAKAATAAAKVIADKKAATESKIAANKKKKAVEKQEKKKKTVNKKQQKSTSKKQVAQDKKRKER